MYVVYYSYRIAMNILFRTLIGQVFCHMLIWENVFFWSSQQREGVYTISYRSQHYTSFALAFSPIGHFWSSVYVRSIDVLF